MNERERLLALEAAMTACENIDFGEMTNTFNLLHQHLLHRMKVGFQDIAYGDYLKEQAAAVKTLAESPETFGAEE